MRDVRYPISATLLLLIALPAFAQDHVAIKNYQHASAALQGAKAVARAGRGQLLAVGSLMTERGEPSNSVVILAEVDAAQMKPGMVLVMERNDCRADVCLIARRVTSAAGSPIETEPYPSIEGLLFNQVQATVLGAVSYSVELESDTIRDLQPGHVESLTFEQAISQERSSVSRTIARR